MLQIYNVVIHYTSCLSFCWLSVLFYENIVCCVQLPFEIRVKDIQ